MGRCERNTFFNLAGQPNPRDAHCGAGQDGPLAAVTAELKESTLPGRAGSVVKRKALTLLSLTARCDSKSSSPQESSGVSKYHRLVCNQAMRKKSQLIKTSTCVRMERLLLRVLSVSVT